MHVQANTDADEVDIDLMVTLLKYICGETPYSRGEEGGLILGAVLVFLPGLRASSCGVFFSIVDMTTLR